MNCHDSNIGSCGSFFIWVSFMRMRMGKLSEASLIYSQKSFPDESCVISYVYIFCLRLAHMNTIIVHTNDQ